MQGAKTCNVGYKGQVPDAGEQMVHKAGRSLRCFDRYRLVWVTSLKASVEFDIEMARGMFCDIL